MIPEGEQRPRLLSPKTIPVCFSEHQSFTRRPHSHLFLRDLWDPNSPPSLFEAAKHASRRGLKTQKRGPKGSTSGKSQKNSAPHASRPPGRRTKWRRPGQRAGRRRDSPSRPGDKSPPHSLQTPQPTPRGEGRDPNHATTSPSRHSPGHLTRAAPDPKAPPRRRNETEQRGRTHPVLTFSTRNAAGLASHFIERAARKDPHGQSGLRPEASSVGAGARNPASVLGEGTVSVPVRILLNGT